jgi:phosphoglycolate phosphatase-like HAD superfamily hydrolase
MMDSHETKLVLFDIDGTMLWSDGAGRRAMTEALTNVFGSAGPTDYHYDGKTDPQIVRDLMRATGHSDATIDERLDPLMERYLGGLERALESRDDIIVGLLTGNLRAGAEIKLRAAGIDVSRFRVCAFGSDHHSRPELPALAQRRAREELGVAIPGERIFVIGDTPADIECGRAIGARAIAVATGRYTPEELARHQPYALFPSLADTQAVMRVIVDA